jgi:hypothetical protein
LVYSKADALPSALEQTVMRKKIIDTKRIPFTTSKYKRRANCSLKQTNGGATAYHTSTTIIATVATTAIILTAGMGEAVIVFGVLGVIGSFV